MTDVAISGHVTTRASAIARRRESGRVGRDTAFCSNPLPVAIADGRRPKGRLELGRKLAERIGQQRPTMEIAQLLQPDAGVDTGA